MWSDLFGLLFLRGCFLTPSLGSICYLGAHWRWVEDFHVYEILTLCLGELVAGHVRSSGKPGAETLPLPVGKGPDRGIPLRTRKASDVLAQSWGTS